jgi:diadenosine tetraphosphate (Ap4A) HIT family hydrolase
MTFEELSDFLEKRMKMSHVYQPLLIKALVDAGGSATIRQIALNFLVQDESQILYYEDRIKSMPVPVLKRHGVVSRNADLITLSVGKLTFEQKAHLKMVCERRLQEFVKKRGLAIWDYRMLDTEPIPDSIRYQVLMESGGRCALCGATKNERPLDVDHIKPRSRGGKTVRENLQVLCSKCNRSKGNKDDTDFRQVGPDDSDPTCPFCSKQIRSRIVEELDSVFAMDDSFGVTPNHTLIIPFRHTADFFSMTSKERNDAEDLLRIMRNRISLMDSSVSGFNVGVNCGGSAGQSVFHAHIHLIPRRDGDTKNPMGGVRGVIPDRMGY